jgi:hypothetical protein
MRRSQACAYRPYNGNQLVRTCQTCEVKDGSNASLGQALALGYSDGITRMCEFHGGKVTGRMVSDLQSFRGVSSIGWAKSEELPKLPVDYTMPEPTVFPNNMFGQTDVTQLLPRLSALPSSSVPYAYRYLVTLTWLLTASIGTVSSHRNKLWMHLSTSLRKPTRESNSRSMFCLWQTRKAIYVLTFTNPSQ